MKRKRIFRKFIFGTEPKIPIWKYYVLYFLRFIEFIPNLFLLVFHKQLDFTLSWSGSMLRGLKGK